MHYSNHNTPVNIKELYELAAAGGSVAYVQLRDVLSSMDTDRLKSLVQQLGREMPRIHDYRWIVLNKIYEPAYHILNTRQSDESFARLLGGVA
jgi:hypothetical protein